MRRKYLVVSTIGKLDILLPFVGSILHKNKLRHDTEIEGKSLDLPSCRCLRPIEVLAIFYDMQIKNLCSNNVSAMALSNRNTWDSASPGADANSRISIYCFVGNVFVNLYQGFSKPGSSGITYQSVSVALFIVWKLRLRLAAVDVLKLSHSLCSNVT